MARGRIDQAPGRRKDPADRMDPSTQLLIAALVLGGVPLLVGWASLHLAALLTGGQDVPGNPIAVPIQLVSGDLTWPTAATVIAVLLVAGSLGLFIAAGIWRGRRIGRRTRVDARAQHLGRGRQLDSISEAGARTTAKRLGVAEDNPGVAIGRAVDGKKMLYAGWEDLHVDIWGPRTGKTTSRVIPAILDAPGAVVTTSNKRDVVDATRLIREQAGQVWVFDPQQVATEPASWWWDPLSYVTDDITAAKLAQHFVASTSDAGAKADAYFEPEGKDLITGYILAAALAGDPITQVYTWVTTPDDTRAVVELREGGYQRIADGLQAAMDLTPKQRDGVYGTAKKMISPLRSRAIEQWVTPQEGRPHFDPAAFLCESGTLYLLSREGEGSASALVTALSVAVIEAAEQLATRSPGGRLAVPLVAALDEAANVVRWTELPSLYSHYGSRGIVILTILQSWSQGKALWGEEGMEKLWSAANIAVYGGGVREAGFLRSLSELVGDHDEITGSIQTGRGAGVSISQQRQQRRTLTVDELQAWPRGRALVLSSGNPPTIVETVPWFTRPDAARVQESIAHYQPRGEESA
ncbi:type IV secretory system conjugative DNA transfer family protein [Tomitella gaofuii]|uniref:type IV secretory system conjugative DNA transfer family protein n=1 Tax=Tomitella gaofuii TaxID=2760083 RepID=UPI001F291EB5|nr:type IV secretory system conjugative DNA transfer family protein [Tomitella gaofuii]